MAIISTVPRKRRRKSNREVHMGATVPYELAAYVTLYCNAYTVPKSELIRRLLHEWVRDCGGKITDEEMYLRIAKRGLAAFNRSRGKSCDAFLRLFKQDLRSKKLTETDISEIIKKFENEYTKQKKAQH